MLVRASKIKNFHKYIEKNIFYIISLLSVTLALSIFFTIIKNIDAHDFIPVVDNKVTNYMFKKRNKRLTFLMKIITRFANWETVMLFYILITIYLYKTRHWNTLIAFGVCIGGGLTFVTLVKNLVDRERPNILNRLMVENSSSFPSGHSFIAVCLYGFIMYLIFHLVDNSVIKFLALISGFSLILSIGVSRIYLGVHWLSDVLGSFSAASGWLLSILTLLQIKRSKDLKKRDIFKYE